LKLYSHIGSALWQVQLFEHVLIHYLSLIFKLELDVAEVEAHAVLEETGKKTLGNLLKELRKYKHLEPDLDARLNSFLQERNWLVHRSRGEHHADVYSPEKLQKLYKRLDTLANEALALSKSFTYILEQHISLLGIEKQQLDAHAIKQLKEWVQS